MQHLSEKTQFLGFLFPLVVQKQKLDEVGYKVSFVYLLSQQHSVKNYHNRFIRVKVISRQSSDIFGETMLMLY